MTLEDVLILISGVVLVIDCIYLGFANGDIQYFYKKIRMKYYTKFKRKIRRRYTFGDGGNSERMTSCKGRASQCAEHSREGYVGYSIAGDGSEHY